MYTGRLQSQLTRGIGALLDITVYRKGENRPERLCADEDLELAPGDVAEIALQTEAGVLTPSIGAPGVSDCSSRASPSSRHATSVQGDACVVAPRKGGLDAGFAGS